MSRLAPQTRSRDFPGTVMAALDAEAWLVKESRALGVGADAEFAINLCLEELFLNAVQHGRANRASISIRAEPDGVRLEFVDDGVPYDPTVAATRRIESPAEDFKIGGFGAGLLKKFSRRMTYRRDDGHNRLVLEFDANAGR
jgi:anti-sigma regulatory factor (Ser/Thr protein kinase)